MTLARAGLTHIVIDTAGNIQAGESVTVYEEDGSNLLVQSMYSAKVGGTALANPALTNNLGVITLYAVTAQRVVLNVGGVNYVSAFESDPADIVLESGTQTLDGKTFTSATLTSPTVTGAAETNTVLTGGRIADTLKFTENAVALSDPGAGLAILKVDTSGDLIIFPTGGAALKFTKSGLIVNADILSSAAIALSKLAAVTSSQVLVGNGTTVTSQLLLTANIATGGQIVKQQLAYNPSTDVASGVAVTANTWTDVTTNQSFTVDDASSLVEIACGGMISLASATTNTSVASRLVIDSAGTPQNKMIGGMVVQVTNQGVNPLAGAKPIKLTGLSAASHTVKLQVYSNTNAATLNALMATLPNIYSISIEVNEFKR